jgi:hypothetical protein
VRKHVEKSADHDAKVGMLLALCWLYLVVLWRGQVHRAQLRRAQARGEERRPWRQGGHAACIVLAILGGFVGGQVHRAQLRRAQAR